MTTPDDPADDLETVDLSAQVGGDAADDGDAARFGRLRGGGWWERNRRWLRPAVAALVVVVAWAAAGVTTAATARDDAGLARDRLSQGRDALVEGDLTAARSAFADAAGILRGVRDDVTGIATLPLRAVPSLRRTLTGVGTLAEAAQLVADAGANVTGHLADLPEGLGGLTPSDGRVPIAPLQRIAPVLAAAAADLTQAAETVRGVPTTGIDPQVAEARDELLEVAGPAAVSLRLAADVSSVLPDIFGAGDVRRYVVLASNPTESRGTGGFLGAYSILEVDDGALRFGPVAETLDLPLLDEGRITWPDPSLADRYDRFGALRSFRNINMTPDFPAAATAIGRFMAAATGQPVDGVIAVDPFAFEALLRIAGPTDVPGSGMVGPDDVVEFVSHSAYATIEDPVERKTLIGRVATAALTAFLQGRRDVDPVEILTLLTQMAERDAVQIWSARSNEQALLHASGLAGDFTHHDADLLSVVLNSGSGSKVDYFLRRSLRYEVDLVADGAVAGTVAIGLDNTAPTEGEPAYMIGLPPPDAPFPSTGVVPVGTNRSYVSTYCAPGCDLFEVPASPIEGAETTIGTELGYGVTSTWVDIPAGQARELVVGHGAPGGWTALGGDRIYALRYAHQTWITPVSVTVSVGIPPGFDVAEHPEGAVVVDGRVEWSRAAVGDEDFHVRFTPI